MRRRKLIAVFSAVPALAFLRPLAAQEKSEKKTSSQDESNTFDKDSVLRDAEEFFGKGAAGLGSVIEKAFKDHGRPSAYIKGSEAAGAITVGLVYGDGVMVAKGGKNRRVYWAGPSIGFDFGANASKVFTLVYNLAKPGAIFQRFPAVDGSFYYVGGAGINYQQRGNIILAPIRLGVGLRAGANIGYQHYTPTKTYNPF